MQTELRTEFHDESVGTSCMQWMIWFGDSPNLTTSDAIREQVVIK